ncbi:MAG: T9SS type A sorting domain-containing protein, partial [Saprospiraceae bacterium]
DTISVLPGDWPAFDNHAGGGVREITNVGPIGPYSSPNPPWQVQGTDNRWAMFDSATDCSGDQDTWLVTAPIDCSDKDEVWLRFEQYYLNFYCETYIRIATDESIPYEEWEEIQINFTTVNQEGPPNILMDLSNFAAGEPTVFIGFEFRNVADQSPSPDFDGCAYNWQIDDLILYDVNPTADHDLATFNDFYAIAPYAKWPVSQLEPFGFLADVINLGQVTQTGVEVALEIEDLTNNDVVHAEIFDYPAAGFPEIAANETFENQLFPDDGFLPADEEKAYVGRYHISADSVDAIPGNNTGIFTFEVTDTIFAKEDTISISIVPQPSNWPAEAPFSWAFGNHYYTPNGDGWFADKVSFALGNPGSVIGKSVTAILYEWTTINFGFPTNIPPNARTVVGFNEYTITGSEGKGELITIDLLDNFTGTTGVALKDGGHYILMLSYETGDRTTPVAIAGSDQKDYAAQIYRAEQQQKARYAGILMIGGITNGVFSTLSFGRNVVPAVRMHITDQLVATKQVLASEHKISAYPNPAKDQITVAFDLQKQQELVTLSIVSPSGSLLQTKRLDDIKEERISLNLEKFTGGSYFLKINTPEGERSIPFVVQH